jgi:eukaryotic-like serine/threonine-protein kinase
MSTSFSHEEWQRIEAILDDVLELEGEARREALDRACKGDARLRAQLESLVAADSRAESFLETPAAEYAAGLVRAASDEYEPLGGDMQPGQQIGPYRLIREIGRGGMGRVFLADRADGQFEQQVALKLVRGVQSGGEILQRFLRERQILARLHHPNIARLLDGGMTPDGRPYFAMEYVSGEPITTYCDARTLDLHARLDLFTAVCDAVQYAHQNLVVHRDLKPSNALVTPDGEVKLLDFGIAKVLHEHEEAGGDPTLTRLGTGPMTPEYAAPEQVRGEPVTTATDVYALGALAYELLTGRGPHRLTRLTAAEVERAITGRDVERPSAAVTRARPGPDGEQPAELVARTRRTDPHRLRRALKGDLDTIVMKALQKEPARRYASAGAFVDDIRRYRGGLPIAARRDSMGYRAGKFVRRHAIGVGATALILATLVAGLIGTAWQARVASREAAKAREVSRFLAGLFAVSDPALANASKITARELLDRGATRIETELAHQPAVQSEMMLLLGRIYRDLSVYDRAQPLLERSLQLRRANAGRDDEHVADATSELGQLALEAGRPLDAERLQRETLALRRAVLGSDHPQVGKTMRDLALVLDFQGKFDEA